MNQNPRADSSPSTALDPDAAVAMLRTMAEMQDAHNCHVHPQWREQGYEYYRAIWVECAELLDHFGWKWWKQQTPDLDQVKLEVVDIWHFGLSDLLRAGSLDDAVAGQLLDTLAAAQSEVHDPATFRLAVEALAGHTLSERAFALAPFAAVMASLPLGYVELFELYVGKNVLNNFRQDHGYKTGDYRKLWAGREDNEHLVEALRSLACEPADVPTTLYRELELRYPS